MLVKIELTQIKRNLSLEIKREVEVENNPTLLWKVVSDIIYETTEHRVNKDNIENLFYTDVDFIKCDNGFPTQVKKVMIYKGKELYYKFV